MKKTAKIFLGISFVFYLFALVVILFLNSRGFWFDMPLLEYIKYSSNIIPFKTINTYIGAISDGSMNMDIPIKNLVGNVILFLPMGVYMPFFIKKIDKISTYFICMSMLLFTVEILQLITRRGIFDIDDFILNMLGALIGYFLYTAVGERFLKRYAYFR